MPPSSCSQRKGSDLVQEIFGHMWIQECDIWVMASQTTVGLGAPAHCVNACIPGSASSPDCTASQLHPKALCRRG